MLNFIVKKFNITVFIVWAGRHFYCKINLSLASNNWHKINNQHIGRAHETGTVLVRPGYLTTLNV